MGMELAIKPVSAVGHPSTVTILFYFIHKFNQFNIATIFNQFIHGVLLYFAMVYGHFVAIRKTSDI